MKTKRDLMLATGGQLAEKLVGYGVMAMLARAFDVVDMGTYFYAMALGELTALIIQFGTNENLVRSVAAEPDKANQRLGEVIGLRVLATVVAQLGLAAFFFLWKPEAAYLAALTTAFMLTRNVYYAFAAFFIGMRRMALRVVTLVSSQLLMLGAAAIGYALNFPFTAVLWSFLAINAALVVLAAIVTRVNFGPYAITLHPRAMRALLATSIGLFATGVIGLLRFKVDTLMLGVIPVSGGASTEEQVAHYESAYKIFEASRFVVRPVILIYLPICAAMYAQHKWPQLSKKLARLYGASFIGGTVMAGIVALLAPWIIPAVYGPKYSSSIPILQVLMLTVPLMYAGFCGQFMANAMHLERKVVIVSLVALAGNVVANAFVIPRYGALGASWTTLGTEALAMAGVGLLVYRRLAYHRKKAKRAEADPTPDAEASGQAALGSASVGLES